MLQLQLLERSGLHSHPLRRMFILLALVRMGLLVLLMIVQRLLLCRKRELAEGQRQKVLTSHMAEAMSRDETVTVLMMLLLIVMLMVMFMLMLRLLLILLLMKLLFMLMMLSRGLEKLRHLWRGGTHVTAPIAIGAVGVILIAPRRRQRA